MYKTFEMELAGRTLKVDVNRVAKQANGAALMHYGDTVVLSTATASDKPREGIDFFPLSVEYNEKLYAVGKLPLLRHCQEVQIVIFPPFWDLHLQKIRRYWDCVLFMIRKESIMEGQ